VRDTHTRPTETHQTFYRLLLVVFFRVRFTFRHSPTESVERMGTRLAMPSRSDGLTSSWYCNVIIPNCGTVLRLGVHSFSIVHLLAETPILAFLLQRLPIEKNPGEQRSRNYERRSRRSARGIREGDHCRAGERKHRRPGIKRVPHRAVDRGMAKKSRVGSRKLSEAVHYP
jgi:hypothetical protein